jgi:hypothetical protein
MLEWNTGPLIAEVIVVNTIAMNKAAITVQATAKKLIGGAGSGRLYKRGKKQHRASSPGQPPARDTGILANSVSFQVGQKGNKIIGSVGPDTGDIKSKKPRVDPDYGLYLELGTSRIAARPWLRPSLIKSRKKIDVFFKKANSRI